MTSECSYTCLVDGCMVPPKGSLLSVMMVSMDSHNCHITNQKEVYVVYDCVESITWE